MQYSVEMSELAEKQYDDIHFTEKILKECLTSNNNVVTIILIGGDEHGKISNS